MTLMVPLTETVERRLRASALALGTPVEDFAAQLLATATAEEDWLDAQYHRGCEADASPAASLDEVRGIFAKLPDSLTADFHAERDE